MRRVALWGAGIILAIVTLTLLAWPDKASSLTMGVLLLAAALDAVGMKPRRQKDLKAKTILA